MIIDWLSFTVECEPVGEEWKVVRSLDSVTYAFSPTLHSILTEMQEFEPCKARRPYSTAYRSKDGLTVFGAGNMPHVLFEFSGQGCQWLRERGYEGVIVSDAKDRMTRLDLALDLPDVQPDEIVEMGYSDRFRAHSRIASDSGVTHYIGSVKSERYARVYRYAPPHERSHLCRIEAVHRKRYAKIAANAIVEHGVNEAGISSLQSYEFVHPAIEHGIALPTVDIQKSSQQTVRWLMSQVAPAFKRLVAEGVIANPDEFLAEHFLTV